MNMTLDQAIEQAEKFTEGATFHAGSEGWKAVMAVLLAEVKKNDDPAAQNQCHDCQCAEEIDVMDLPLIRKAIEAGNQPPEVYGEALAAQPPHPAYILAATADQLADQLADFAGELNLFHVSYEMDASHFKLQSKRLVDIAKQLREE